MASGGFEDEDSMESSADGWLTDAGPEDGDSPAVGAGSEAVSPAVVVVGANVVKEIGLEFVVAVGGESLPVIPLSSD